MKKLASLVIIIFVLGMVGLGFTMLKFKEDVSHISIEETTAYGDKSVVNGLEVQTRMIDNSGLLAEASYVLGEKYAKESKILPFVEEKEQNSPDKWRIECRMGQFPRKTQSGVWTGVFPSKLATLCWKTHAQMQTQSETMVINVKDIWQYYPTYIYCTYAKKTYELPNFLIIPVIESEQRKVTVSKCGTGLIAGNEDKWYTTTEMGEGDSYPCEFYGVATEDSFYCVFDTHTKEGKMIDLSEMKEGYGIYQYSFDETLEKRVEIGTFGGQVAKNVFPLNPQIKIINLYVNKEENKLMLVTMENQGYVATIIDTESMEQVDRIEVPNIVLDSETDDFEVYFKEEFFIINCDDTYWHIFSCASDKAGRYEYSMNVSELDYNFSEIKLDYNGTNLVIARLIEETSYKIRVDVYEKTELVYSGEYKSSLQIGETDFKYKEGSKTYENYFMPAQENPMEIYWK